LSGRVAGPTAPFYTFDPINGEGFDALVTALKAPRDNDKLDTFLEIYPEIRTILVREGADCSNGAANISWDPATILFIAYRETQPDGSPGVPLERGISMERLGRFPTQDGNAISYLRENLREYQDSQIMAPLLDQLDIGLRNESIGDNLLSEGFAGLTLHGWLSATQVGELRIALQKSKWKVAKNEPFDGGVADVARHLLIVLKSAEKRRCGILMRAHS
jgi:hypothetical protein